MARLEEEEQPATAAAAAREAGAPLWKLWGPAAAVGTSAPAPTAAAAKPTTVLAVARAQGTLQLEGCRSCKHPAQPLRSQRAGLQAAPGLRRGRVRPARRFPGTGSPQRQATGRESSMR